MMKKRFTSLLIILAMSLSMLLPASAADHSIKQIEGGPNCSFVLTNDGTLYVCGDNHQGILGPDVGEHTSSQGLVVTTLTKIAEDVKEVAASETPTIHYYKNPYEQGYHVLILMENGDLYAQGDNLYAQLGQDDRDPHEGMQFVMGNVKAIAAGSYFSACVTEDGELYWWGYLVQQLGGNEVANTFDPEKVGSGFVDVEAGTCTLTALKEDGTVWTMGSSAHGARGDGETDHLTRNPEQVFSGAVEIAAGENHTLVRTAAGDVYGWGDNSSQQLLPHQLQGEYVYDAEGYIIEAPERFYDQYTTPVYIMGGAKDIEAHHNNSYVIKTNGDLYTMGSTYDGQFGIDVNPILGEDLILPAVKTAANVKQVSGGYCTTYILKEDGSTHAAGNNYYYNFGNGTFIYHQNFWTPAFFTALPVHDPDSMAFTDVKESDWFYAPVKWAVENNVTSGTGDGTTFSPNSICSRAQIITFLWAASGRETGFGSTFHVTDLYKSDWYYNAVYWATTRPTTGTPVSGHLTDSKFRPNDPCTRAMAVEFIWRAMGSPAYDTSSLPFTDVKPTDSYAQAVAWALDNGVTSGTSATTFGPNVTCTRSQIATFLYQAYN